MKVVVAISMLACLGYLNSLSGATLYVTTTNDSGAGSLRQIVNNAAAGDVIQFSTQGMIALTTGEIYIKKNLILNGQGASKLLINGSRKSRIFNIAANTTVTLSSMAIPPGIRFPEDCQAEASTTRAHSRSATVPSLETSQFSEGVTPQMELKSVSVAAMELASTMKARSLLKTA
jgi:hypothetical protein